MNGTATDLKYMMHRVFSGATRQRLYTLPYFFYIHAFMRRMHTEQIPLFRYIEIETVNRCNGGCTFCPVNVAARQRPYAKMEEHLFTTLIDELRELDYAGEIHLFSNNEPFLDERIFDFAAYARKQCARAKIVISSNGSLLTLEKVRRIQKNLDSLIIDHYTNPDTKAGGSNSPAHLNTKPDESNPHAVPDAKAGRNNSPANWKTEAGESDNAAEQHLQEIAAYVRAHKGLHRKIRIVERNETEQLSSRGGQAPNKPQGSMRGLWRGCIYPYTQMVVRPDGKCSLCCNDALGKYTLGDTNRQSLTEIWYAQAYQRIRQKMMEKGRAGLRLCRNCDAHNFI